MVAISTGTASAPKMKPTLAPRLAYAALKRYGTDVTTTKLMIQPDARASETVFDRKRFDGTSPITTGLIEPQLAAYVKQNMHMNAMTDL